MDQGKGQPIDSESPPSAHAEYSTVYYAAPLPVLENYRPRRSRMRRICVRVIHLMLLDILIFLVLLYVFKDIKAFVRSVRGLFGGRPGWTTVPGDDGRMPLTHDCAEVVEWRPIEDHDGHQAFAHGVQADVDLPVASDLLYFLSYGDLTHGAIRFVDTGAEDSNVTSVNVKFFYDDENLDGLTKVCRLQKSEGRKNGVSVFSPHGRRLMEHRRTSTVVTVKLPRASSITALETRMPLFLHDLADLRDSVSFRSVKLSTTNSPVVAKHLSAARTHVFTTNSPISGVFNSTEFIDLTTSNAHIDVELRLSSGLLSSTANLHTTNAFINAAVSLNSIAKDHNDGTFHISAKTSNAPLDFKFNSTLVSSTFRFEGATHNAPATVRLHDSFEGVYDISTGRWFEAGVYIEDKEDPAGQGRNRSVVQRKAGRGHSEGMVSWAGPKDRRSGDVIIHTSNSPVHLYL